MSLSRLAELDVYDECYVYLYCDPRHIAGWTQEVEYDTFDPIHSKDGVDFVQEYLRGVASCSLDTLAASIFYVGKGRHLRSHEHLEKVSKMCHRFLKTGGPKWPKEVEEMRRWAVVSEEYITNDAKGTPYDPLDKDSEKLRTLGRWCLEQALEELKRSVPTPFLVSTGGY
ncbi:hypothetical protein AAVH_08135 [Aphelenchoides avenae]|nr:hypothetical protein AAVH_08135 [Aphelenchus avenae]